MLDKDLESNNVCGVECAGGENRPSAGGVRCACGRWFVPSYTAQKFCGHACYSASIRVPIEQRFWTKVNKNGPPPAHIPQLGRCWIWTAGTIRGYGQIAGIVNGKRRPVYAHRFAWEMAHGPIENHLQILHRCDTPLCVRPDHLFVGTPQDNLNDARIKGRLDETRPRVRVLTPTDRLAIFEARGYRGICVELARRYGVTKPCISMIRKGRFKRPVFDICNVEPVSEDIALDVLREFRRSHSQPLQPFQSIA